MDKNIQSRNGANDGKSKAKSFWKGVGVFCIAVVLAIVTVFVLNLNR